MSEETNEPRAGDPTIHPDSLRTSFQARLPARTRPSRPCSVRTYHGKKKILLRTVDPRQAAAGSLAPRGSHLSQLLVRKYRPCRDGETENFMAPADLGSFPAAPGVQPVGARAPWKARRSSTAVAARAGYDDASAQVVQRHMDQWDGSCRWLPLEDREAPSFPSWFSELLTMSKKLTLRGPLSFCNTRHG